MIDRRSLLRATGTFAAALAAPALAQAKPRIVVVGGGPGGATAAKYLLRDGAPLDVTLIEANRTYVTPFTSNLYLGGLKSYDTLEFGYAKLAEHGVKVRIDSVADIDREARRVRTRDGVVVPYDRLILSPGIDFRWSDVPGYSEAAAATMPHAYRGGEQFQLLKRMLDAVPD